MRLLFVMYKMKRNWILVMKKGIFVGYDKQSPAYLIYFPETTAIKRFRCVKFTDSHNSPRSKLYKNTEISEYLITYDDKQNIEGEGQISRYPIRQRKISIFL